MRGFSLIELLVTLAITSLLAALALPGYTHMMNRALRQDARISLLRLQHREETIFANRLSYSAETGNGGQDAALPERSDQGHYLLEVRVSADGMSYTALARVSPDGRQASDSNCMLFAVDQTGRRRSADSAGNWRDDDPYRCWG